MQSKRALFIATTMTPSRLTSSLRKMELEEFGVFLVKTWYIVGAVLLVVFLAYGYATGHCVLCKGLKNALNPAPALGASQPD
jgi:hypothetical protein